MNRVLFFDVEAPNRMNDRISQIGLIIDEDGNTILKQSYLINPETSFAAASMALAGVTPASIQNAPTFDAVWSNIRPYFETSLVVSYNADNAISALVRTLEHYNLDFGAIEYADTYEKVKSAFHLESCFLDQAAERCGYTMSYHNDVLDNAGACRAVYYDIAEKGLWEESDYHTVWFVSKQQQSANNGMAADMIALKGILQGIHSSGKITSEEMHLLKLWINEHKNFHKAEGYSGILLVLETVTADGALTDEEYRILMDALDRTAVHHDVTYSGTTLAMQELKGIIEGIKADGKVEEEELVALGQWMKEHSDLAGVHSFDKIFSTIVSVMDDGVITEEEHELLLKEFDHFSGDAGNAVDITGRKVYLAGTFQSGSSNELARRIKAMGGSIAARLTGRTDILLAGENAGEDLEKARQMQKKGSKILILSESDLFRSR